VHFLRFELTDDMAKALKYGVALSLGIDHQNYQAEVGAVTAGVRASLAQDLD